MKKLISTLLFMAIMSYNGMATAQSGAPGMSAKGAVMIEQHSGRVLYALNENARLPMASTTKVMTALVVLENCDPSAIVTVDPSAVGIGGSSMFLEKGEILTVEELLYGLMLRSGNDAAVALAIHCAGSVEGFVSLMNATASEMGLADTNFINPHGLPGENHYTTARELAEIAAKAMEYPLFRQIVSTQRKQIDWDGHAWDRVMTNKNKILSLIEGGNGIKTGYTKKAGRCLVSSAYQEEMQLICVTLNCGDDFNSSAKLMKWGFEIYDMLTAAEPGEKAAEIMTDAGLMPVLYAERLATPAKQGETARIEIDLPEAIRGDIAYGAQVGTARLVINGETAAQARLVIEGRVKYDSFTGKLRKIMMMW